MFGTTIALRCFATARYPQRTRRQSTDAVRPNAICARWFRPEPQRWIAARCPLAEATATIAEREGANGGHMGGREHITSEEIFC